MECRKGEDGNIYISGSVTSENAEEFKECLLRNAQEEELVIDCRELSYISSAGLRVFAGIMHQGKKLRLIDVNPVLYETLKITGLADRMEVKQALRKVSIKGLPLIGTGGTASVYRLDDDKVIKVYHPNVSREVIEQENEITRKAFLSGIDTMIAYDIISTEGGLASVFENIDARELIYYMKEDHSRLEELLTSFGLFVRENHKKTLDPGSFGSAKEKTLEILGQYERLSISREASDRLVSLVERMVPRTEEFSHGDCHAGNVMLKDGQFLFIDVGRMSCGHLIYDLWSMFVQYRYQAFHHMGDMFVSPLAKDFSPEERALIWDSYFFAATGIRDEELKRKAEEQISVFAGIRLLEARFYVKGFLPDEIYGRLVEELLAYEAQGSEPLVF